MTTEPDTTDRPETRDADTIRARVTERYGAFAEDRLQGGTKSASSCCGGGECGPSAGEQVSSWVGALYEAKDTEGLTDELVGLSLGCGNPVDFAGIHEGETVLDLGSGAGLDCFLAGRKVGPTGRVIGVDMTDPMLELANRNRAELGVDNVEFRKGSIESLPVETGTVDVILSNCVINLAPDKRPVLAEAARVLKPGGRFRVSDIVWTREPTAAEKADLSSWVGCIAGALTVTEFRSLLEEVGFTDVDIALPLDTHEDGWASAKITATRA